MYDSKLINPFKYDLTKDVMEDLCKSSYSIAEVIYKSGRKCTGGNYQLIKSKIIQYGIDISHFTGSLWSKGKTSKDDNRISSKPTKYFDENQILGYHPDISRCTVKKYIIRNNIIPYKCAFCGNTGYWNGKEISLELDHINGNPYDHSKENLRFLCPNCHATTDTYTNKSRD